MSVIPIKTEKKTLFAVGFLALLAFAVEGLFFNFHSFRLLGGGFSHHNVPLNQVEVQGFTYDETTGYLNHIPDQGDYYFELKNFNQKAGTIYINFLMNNTENQEGGAPARGEDALCNAAIWYTDRSNTDYAASDLRPVSANVEESKYFTCWFYGPSRDLRVYFDTTPITVTGFEINKPVPWKFEPLRFCAVFGILLLAYLITKNRWFLCPAKEQRISHRLVTLCGMLAFCAFLYFTAYTSLEYKTTGLDSGDLYSQDLTDAFLAGQFSLLTEPDPLLQTLDNPYDINARLAVDLYADWQYRMDVSYYNNKYYCYFGPVPSLLLFVPYTLATGQYLQTGWACLIFAVFAAIFMAMALEAFVKKYYGSLPYGYLFLGNLILWFSGGLLWNVRRPMFYELAILSSAAFVSLGFYLIIKAIGEEKLFMAPLAGGCLSLALAVGCRPLSILYSAAIVPVLWTQYQKYKTDRTTVRRAAAAIALPYLLVGGLLAYYNLARFGSITEFGVTYQLSTIDMTGESWKPQALPICIWLTMLTSPVINCNFPFVYGDMTGQLYFLGRLARQNREIGLFFLNPILFILASPAAVRQAKRAYGKGPVWAVLFTLACALAVFTLSSFTGGVAVRYATDYGVVMSGVALLIFFGLYPAAEEKELTGLLSKLLLIAAAIAVFLGFFRSLMGEDQLLLRYHPDLYTKLRYVFCFWM